MKKENITAQKIDALLPQTQCGLCTYQGCMPYAEALANNQAEINLCPPGGVNGLIALAQLLNKDPAPFINEMQQKTKQPSRAVIREAECIGCTKCIQACPVDAILGSGKLMHTVIADECTGCELCIAPCPVDCIDMINVTETINKSNHYRRRYNARNQRLEKNDFLKNNSSHTEGKLNMDDKKNYLAAALLRVKQKFEKT